MKLLFFIIPKILKHTQKPIFNIKYYFWLSFQKYLVHFNRKLNPNKIEKRNGTFEIWYDISNVMCVDCQLKINNMAAFPLRVLFYLQRAIRRTYVSSLLWIFPINFGEEIVSIGFLAFF